MASFSPAHRRNLLQGMGEKLVALVIESAPREQLGAWLRVPLEHAAAKADVECVTKLLAAGADARVRSHDVPERSPLAAAAGGGNGAIVSALLESGSKPNGEEWEGRFYDIDDDDMGSDSTGGGSSRWSPLHSAASGGHVAAVRALVRAGANMDVKDEEGCSPLHLAVFRGFEEVVEELVAAGANVDTNDSEGETPLHTACGHGNLVMVRAILRGSRDQTLCAAGNGGVHLGMSPLHRAGLGGHCEVMGELLDHGASPNSLACNARTALHAAALSGSADAVGFLLNRDLSSLEAADQEGRTALHLASGHRLGSDGTLTALLVAGANMEAATVLGETPLHNACKALRVSAVKILLRWGANEAAVNVDGSTPAAMASQLLQSQFPGVYRDMLDEMLRMLAKAPADRAWRRRGWLLILRRRQQKADFSDGNLTRGEAQQRTLAGYVIGAADSNQTEHSRPTKIGKGSPVVVVPAQTSSAASGKSQCGERAQVKLQEGRVVGTLVRDVQKKDDGGEEGDLRSMVERAVGVGADEVFRNILTFV